MKLTILNLKSLTITLLLVLFAKYSSAQQIENHEFMGTIFIDDKKAKDVTVKVFDKNKCFSTFETRSNGKFIFTAGMEKHYTLQFEKEGYVTKRIIVNTRHTRGVEYNNKMYKFDINLEKKLADVDYSLHDFPATIIEFDLVKNEFDYNEKYTHDRLTKIAMSGTSDMADN